MHNGLCWPCNINFMEDSAAPVESVAKLCPQDKTLILHLLAWRHSIQVSQCTQATVTEISPISWRDKTGYWCTHDETRRMLLHGETEARSHRQDPSLPETHCFMKQRDTPVDAYSVTVTFNLVQLYNYTPVQFLFPDTSSLSFLEASQSGPGY